MKTVRAIYVWAMYIIGSPLILLMVLVATVWNAVECVKDKFGFKDFIELEMAIFEGMREGHKINKFAIEHGRMYNNIEELDTN